jgi:hypothetical protein
VGPAFQARMLPRSVRRCDNPGSLTAAPTEVLSIRCGKRKSSGGLLVARLHALSVEYTAPSATSDRSSGASSRRKPCSAITPGLPDHGGRVLLEPLRRAVRSRTAANGDSTTFVVRIVPPVRSVLAQACRATVTSPGRSQHASVRRPSREQPSPPAHPDARRSITKRASRRKPAGVLEVPEAARPSSPSRLATPALHREHDLSTRHAGTANQHQHRRLVFLTSPALRPRCHRAQT